MTTTTQTAPAVTLNPRYAVPNHPVSLSPTWLTAVFVPASFWAVKVREHAGQWIAFAVPRFDTPGDPFLLAAGTDRQAVFGAAIRWTAQAKTLAGRIDRVVFAGYGTATHERLSDLDGLRAALTDWESAQ